jgi:hypothetical protein
MATGGDWGEDSWGEAPWGGEEDGAGGGGAGPRLPFPREPKDATANAQLLVDIDVIDDLPPDFRLAAGAKNLGNAILRRLATPTGTLARGFDGDPDYGYDLRQRLNKSWRLAELAGEQGAVEDQVALDRRVERAEVTVTLNPVNRDYDLGIRIEPVAGAEIALVLPTARALLESSDSPEPPAPFVASAPVAVAAADLGVDIDVLDDLSPTFDLTSGRDNLVKAYLRRLVTPGGALALGFEGEPNYGHDLRGRLNAAWTVDQVSDLQVALEDQALQDERIEAATVSVAHTPATRTLDVTVELEAAGGPYLLILAVSDVGVELLRVE